MSVPDFQTLMLPVLRHLGDGQPRPWKQLVRPIADEFQLTEDDLSVTIASGQTRIGNRIQWVLSHLFQAGLLARPDRGVVVITKEGQAVLAESPDRLDMAYLRRYPSYVEFRNRSRTKGESDAAAEPRHTGPDAAEAPTEAPEELIQRAVDENRAAVEGELLDRLLGLDPTTFERLVIKLLSAMGYGKSGRIEHSGRSGDGGIDGIISQDPLGLDRVYMQAKRYARDHAVGRPAIQEFVGALHGVQADRGVFIATSSFTSGARDYAERVGARVVLIDGDRLAVLMVHYVVGVQPDFTAVLHRVDEDFFETL